MLPVEPDDEDKYEVITNTSPRRWTPHEFTIPPDDTYVFDPADSSLAPNSDYPSVLNHVVIQMDKFEANDPSNDMECHMDRPVCLSDKLCMTYVTQPVIESQILAIVTWYRFIHKDIHVISYDLTLVGDH